MHEKKGKLFKLRKTAFSSNIQLKKYLYNYFYIQSAIEEKNSSRVVESFSSIDT